ncbi:5-dehydro-2-deoxygluconokinase [Sesamum angolense]|uniref:5-dehydro-2-deoxygluconokinase n=1 Tax=Sesamum angolense TaxID=2727404 RepID=A0AAE1WC82_9LAMI|nr:5-dehydro-2-deoxygluconokinase [Sesamum angolense]
MGIEIQHKINNGDDTTAVAAVAPVILGLQPSALVDHVATVDLSLLSRIPGEPGGSFPVAVEELKFVLGEVNAHIVASPETTSSLKTIAGGSVANTIRGLAAGFGITCGIIGACGDDDQGSLFIDNMSFYKVDLSRLRLKNGSTGQCVCLVDELGNRTMRPCLSSAVKIQANDLTTEDLKGSKVRPLWHNRYAPTSVLHMDHLFLLILVFLLRVQWLVLRYAIFNIEVIQAAIKIAKQEGVSVSLDLASFEMVRKFRLPLLQLLESGSIDLCFANEDEAAELLRDEENAADPESALDFLAKHCQWAVVTLGAKGCIAKHGKEVVRVPAIGESKAVDATGAGDLFASGFLYGLVKGLSLEACCKIGSCSGGSVIRSLGGEVTPENWQWMYKQMQTKGLPVPEPHNVVL